MSNDTEVFLLTSAKLLRIYSENIVGPFHFSDLTGKILCCCKLCVKLMSFETARKIFFSSCTHGILIIMKSIYVCVSSDMWARSCVSVKQGTGF